MRGERTDRRDERRDREETERKESMQRGKRHIAVSVWIPQHAKEVRNSRKKKRAVMRRSAQNEQKAE